MWRAAQQWDSERGGGHTWNWSQRCVENFLFALFRGKKLTLLRNSLAALRYIAHLNPWSSVLFQTLNLERLQAIRAGFLRQLAAERPRSQTVVQVRAQRAPVDPQGIVDLITALRAEYQSVRRVEHLEQVAVIMLISFIPCRAQDIGLARRGDFSLIRSADEERLEWTVVGTKHRSQATGYIKTIHASQVQGWCPVQALQTWFHSSSGSEDDPAFPSFTQLVRRSDPGSESSLYASTKLNAFLFQHRDTIGPRVTSHCFRHTSTILLRRVGVPDHVIMQLGNWKNPAMIDAYSRHAIRMWHGSDWWKRSAGAQFTGNLSRAIGDIFASLT